MIEDSVSLEEADNFVINECLAYLSQSFIPVVPKEIIREPFMQKCLLDLVTDVADKWNGRGLLENRASDPEEFLYQ